MRHLDGIFMRTAEAQGVTEAASPQQGGTLGFFLPMILIFGIFYFLLIRPQAKQRKKHQALLQNLKSGDLVITASGIHGKVAGIACDVRDYEQVKALMEFAVKTFGGLDILVNNAGTALFAEVADLKPEEWREVIDTNLTGVFYCCHEAIPKMRSRGGGYIINIGSLAGVNAHPKMAAYNASKFGLLGFSEALFQEVRYDGIRVSHILPGSVETEFRAARKEKVGWAILPEHIAEMVVFLLKSHPRTMTSRIEMRPSQPRKS